VAGHDVVLNCAGWTDVDAAESHEAEAFAVNAEAVRSLAAACAATDARLVHVSTDYVFDGLSREPYAESAVAAPVNAYGRTKLAGEQAVADELGDRGVVVRTAWLYGAPGRSFVRTIIDGSVAARPIEVVADLRGQPSWVRPVAQRLVALGVMANAGGVYHATCRGDASWFEFAREVYRLAGADPELVLSTSSGRLRRAARRPRCSVLGDRRGVAAGLDPMPTWQDALSRALIELTGVTGTTGMAGD
jgi:dTDP-4-dehydrorhamnose reductase